MRSNSSCAERRWASETAGLMVEEEVLGEVDSCRWKECLDK